jgi:hypothetical protein
MNKINFERNIDNVLVTAYDICVEISCDWTVLVSKEKAIEYVKNYGSSTEAGFFDLHHDGKVMFSHNSGKITFSRQEADAIVELIKAAYMAP